MECVHTSPSELFSRNLGSSHGSVHVVGRTSVRPGAQWLPSLPFRLVAQVRQQLPLRVRTLHGRALFLPVPFERPGDKMLPSSCAARLSLFTISMSGAVCLPSCLRAIECRREEGKRRRGERGGRRGCRSVASENPVEAKVSEIILSRWWS